MPFYESLRVALASDSRGVHWAGKPLSAASGSTLEPSPAPSLPPAYIDFVRSFDGILLFHESFQIYASNDSRLTERPHEHLRMGEYMEHALWMNQQGQIFLVDEHAPDPVLLGSSLEALLNATLARESLLVDRNGDFRDVFDEEGDLVETVRQKQYQVGQKKDSAAAWYWWEEAEWHVDQGEDAAACAALVQALERDPSAGPCLELYASLLRGHNSLAATEQFVAAARAALHPPLQAARWAQAALLAPQLPLQQDYAAQMWRAHPGYLDELLTQAQHLAEEAPAEATTRMVQVAQLLNLLPTDAPDVRLLHFRHAQLQQRQRGRSLFPLVSS